MTIRNYLRTDSDCILLYRNEQNAKLGECQALIYTAFEQYVLKGKCGTDKCPFYKKKWEGEGMTGYRLCDNCALKYADCKGDKSLEKTKCDYYKKPVVMNVKELAERVAELEIKLKDSVEVVRCKDCKLYISERNECTLHGLMFVYPEFYCRSGERRE